MQEYTPSPSEALHFKLPLCFFLNMCFPVAAWLAILDGHVRLDKKSCKFFVYGQEVSALRQALLLLCSSSQPPIKCASSRIGAFWPHQSLKEFDIHRPATHPSCTPNLTFFHVLKSLTGGASCRVVQSSDFGLDGFTVGPLPLRWFNRGTWQQPVGVSVKFTGFRDNVGAKGADLNACCTLKLKCLF